MALFFTLLALFPLVWVIIAGFKEKTEVLSTPFRFLPREWLAANYLDILKDTPFRRAMLTTFGGALLFAVLSLAVNSAAAYVFARLEFRFKTFMWLYVITTMLIPGMAILLTSFIVVNKLAMLDTFAVLVLPGIASAGSMFFIRQFYLNIPLALEEAALIDGAGRLRIFTSIFVPMSFPVFVIVGIGAYLGYWNSFVWPTMTITTRICSRSCSTCDVPLRALDGAWHADGRFRAVGHSDDRVVPDLPEVHYFGLKISGLK